MRASSDGTINPPVVANWNVSLNVKGLNNKISEHVSEVRTILFVQESGTQWKFRTSLLFSYSNAAQSKRNEKKHSHAQTLRNASVLRYQMFANENVKSNAKELVDNLTCLCLVLLGANRHVLIIIVLPVTLLHSHHEWFYLFYRDALLFHTHRFDIIHNVQFTEKSQMYYTCIIHELNRSRKHTNQRIIFHVFFIV